MWIALATFAAASLAPGETKDLALLGAKAYPAPRASPIQDAVVLIREGKIFAVGERGKLVIPDDTATLECAGLTVTAGFQNSHVHFTEPKWENAAAIPAERLGNQLQDMLTRYGFTAVVDTGSLLPNTLAIRQRIESGEVSGPRILTAGVPLYPKNGIPYYLRDSVPASILQQLPQVERAEEVGPLVEAQIAGGADVVKVFAVSWVRRGRTKAMSLDAIRAATAEAHRRGKLVYAHPSLVEGIWLALAGQVDVLAHTVENPERFSDLLIAQMRYADISLVPTLKLLGSSGGSEGVLGEVKSFASVGGRILFGTDVGFLTDYDPTEEYVLMSRAGLSFDEILASLFRPQSSFIELTVKTT